MKLKIFTYILFLSYSLSAQKFAVIENKGENAFSSESLMNQKISEVKLDTETPQNWHLFLNVPTSKSSYGTIKSMLNIINNETQF